MFVTLRNPALVKIYLIPLVSNITMSMTGAIGVLYALDLGSDVLTVNLIMTIQSAMTIFIELPFGILSDHFGRKRMLEYPRLLTLVGTGIRTFATEPGHLLVAAFVGGFAGGGFFPILLSMIADIAEPEEHKEAISTLFLFSSLGMLLGPFLCSLLLLNPKVTLRNIYQIHLVASVVAELYIITQVQETISPTQREKVDFKSSVSELVKKASFRNLLIMTALYNFYFSTINTYVPIFAREMNLSDAEVASFSTYRNLGNILIRFSLTTFLIEVPVRPFLITALAMGGLTGIITSFTSDYLSLSLIIFLSGVSFGIKMILGHHLVAKDSTSRNRGVANGVFGMAQTTGNIAKIATTPIVAAFGIPFVFLVGGFAAFLSVVPMLSKRNSPAQAMQGENRIARE